MPINATTTTLPNRRGGVIRRGGVASNSKRNALPKRCNWNAGS